MTRVRYEAEHLLLADGWASPGWFEVDDHGAIVAMTFSCSPKESSVQFIDPAQTDSWSRITYL